MSKEPVSIIGASHRRTTLAERLTYRVLVRMRKFTRKAGKNNKLYMWLGERWFKHLCRIQGLTTETTYREVGKK